MVGKYPVELFLKIIKGKYLEQRDEDDIPFLALNLTLKTHGVLTKDKDITDQSEIKTWRLAEVGQAITEISKGTYSLIIACVSVKSILELVLGFLSVVWAVFIETVESFIIYFTSVLEGSIQAIDKIPLALALILLAVAGSILFLAQQRVGEFFKILMEQIKRITRVLKEIFKAVWEILKNIFDAFKPFLNISSELLSYFMLQSQQMMTRLEELEKLRPQE